ncbi:MAG: hypothetical protein ACLTGN_10590, partial [Clostridium sp.]
REIGTWNQVRSGEMYAFVILLYHAKEETTTKTGLISTPNAGMNTVFLNYLHSRPKRQALQLATFSA